MKILRLPQPYATMVVKGLLPIIRNEWQDLQEDERIYIYAEKYANEFYAGVDFKYSMHCKVYNELFFGNLTENLPTNCIVGYVVAGQHCSSLPRYYDSPFFMKKKKRKKRKKSAAASDAKKIELGYIYTEKSRYFPFPNLIKNYSPSNLDSIRTRGCNPKRISFSDGELIVPIGRDFSSQTLFNIQEYDYLKIFIDDHIEKLIYSLGDNVHLTDKVQQAISLNKVKSITFICGTQNIKFEGPKHKPTPNLESFVNYDFDDWTSTVHKCIKFGLPDLHRNDVLYIQLFGFTESKPDYDINNEYVQFFNTPMGGANKRR